MTLAQVSNAFAINAGSIALFFIFFIAVIVIIGALYYAFRIVINTLPKKEKVPSVLQAQINELQEAVKAISAEASQEHIAQQAK